MGLRALPCVDSAEIADLRRRELDIDRATAARLGTTAVRACEQGSYDLGNGKRFDWAALVAASINAKISIAPDAPLPTGHPRMFDETSVAVCNETTLSAAKRIADAGARPLALNMANGITPGGGFLSGARAQEETLCRSSALFATLEGDPMYQAHQDRADYESSSWIILSPDVPVFRTDPGVPLTVPWLCNFITCAAPYAPQVGKRRSAELQRSRIHRLLEIAAAYEYDTLVLGAWGCGAFGNDPVATAASFADALAGPMHGRFREVVFAITDWSLERRFLGPFRDLFSSEPSA